ncbi:PAS domain S-box protein [Mucilaginibacter sp.]|uniref:PAS domain S-box protein n=1 Tax=Mucilaginibacter sp. TaxID=1882438 RepID=UPI003D0B9272
MSFRSRLLLFLQNDNTIYQLLLIGLFIASPSLHYLCYYNSFDPLWLRFINSGLCLAALCLSYYPDKLYYKIVSYLTIISFLVINNCLLLGKNGFEHAYLFSSITVFIALTLFCTRRWEFIAICALNLLATVIAYITAPKLDISIVVLVVLLLTFTFIAYVSFLVMVTYNLKFKKAVSSIVDLNKTLIANEEKMRASSNSLTALINSLNDIIFEFDEDKICLNVWFNGSIKRVIDPRLCIGKKISEIIGQDKAQKFDDAFDAIIANKQPVTLEYPSDFETGKWLIAKMAPVYDSAGNYTSRISASVTDITEQKNYADALKEQEILLLEAQSIAKTGNWSYDHQKGESFWSKNLYTILEVDSIPEDTSMFDYYLSLIHPDDRENAFEYFSNINVPNKSDFEHKLITPNGSLKYLKALKGDTTVNEKGELKRAVGVIQDITETRLSEKIIKVSQAELLEAQIIAKIGNWKWDITMNKLSWSDEINNIFEIDQKAATENNFVKVLIKYCHPNDREILKKHLISFASINNTSYEYRIITPQGNVKHLSIIVGKLLRRDDGTVRKIIGTLQDVTDRKQAEIEQQQTENKYKLILETIKLPALSVDSKGIVIFCNKYMAEMLGYDQHEMLGVNWLDNFIPDGIREELKDWFVNNKFDAQFTNPVICRNGEQRLISWQNTVSYDENGKIKEVTGIGEDITDRERATQALISAKENAEKSSHFKSEFLSIMSHEIRTPMNAVIGTTNLLLSEDPKPDQLEYLNTLKFSGENLLAIINDILDYNKIEAGKLELNKLPFNIVSLTQKIKQSFYAKAAEKDLEIELLLNNLPEYLIGDQIRLSQVLNNLLSNAIKFTHTGKVTLKLDSKPITNNQVAVEFTITDTGIGIGADNLAHIFDPFMQESQTADKDYGGTGLGLAITKRLVELHQSAISVTSKSGVGTQFTFTIIFNIAPKQTNEDKAPPALVRTLQGMRILIVDDNKMNLLIASKFLKKWQAETTEALSGEQAISLVKINVYDLIIMDLQMPEMDGFETTRAIRDINPYIPVIALTADAMPETHAKAFAAGMCDYLTKPFVPDVLFEKIAKHYTPAEIEIIPKEIL